MISKVLTIAAELAAVGLVAAGVYLTFGTGAALIVAGSLLLAGIEFYGIRGEPDEDLDDEESGIRISYDGDANESGSDLRTPIRLDDGRRTG